MKHRSWEKKKAHKGCCNDLHKMKDLCLMSTILTLHAKNVNSSDVICISLSRTQFVVINRLLCYAALFLSVNIVAHRQKEYCISNAVTLLSFSQKNVQRRIWSVETLLLM